MEVNEENQEQNQEVIMPSLNDIISGDNEVNPNQVNYQQITTTEKYQPAEQTKYTYTTTKIMEENGQEEEGEIPQEITEIKSEYKKDGGENKRYEQTMQIKEEPNSTTKIVKRVIQSEHPTTSETSYYQKRVIKTTTTTTRGGNTSENQNINSRYSNTNTTTNSTNIVRSGGNRYQSGTTTSYTRPSPTTRGGTEKNTYMRNYDSGRTPSTSRVESNQSNRYAINSSDNNYSSKNRNGRIPIVQKNISSQSFVGNKYQQKRPENPSYNRQARSPGQNEIKRKTINRGNPVKNVQITHIINSSKPQDFHITENLDTESLQTDPIEISQADRIKLKKTGISSYTTSVQDNIKPIVKNLKGKTTIFQHARGIGMTNERKENINPMFYSSEIKKLDPIIKEKEKEKVEYMTFRNETNDSNTSNTARNYNRGNYTLQKNSYASNNNPNYNNSRGSKISTVRTNQTYTRGNYSRGGNDGEIVKETKTKVQMGSRSQYKGTGNPTSSVTTERRVYNSNAFFNK